ncbi:hypothetical protein EBU24_01045 [bacterium]|nr:hypothetical protein [bacterium]
MTILYRRCWRLKFYDKKQKEILTLQENLQTVNPLRITFFIRQLIYIVNYMANIKIYNLSEDTKSLIHDAYAITFETGYDDELKLLHKGLIVNKYDLRQQPDYIYVIATQDLFDNVRPFSINIPKTKTDREAIKLIAKAADIPDLIVQDGNLKGLKDKPIGHDFNAGTLNYFQTFQQFADEEHLNLWITNGVLYTTSKTPDEIRDDDESKKIILNYTNGMVGSPQIDVANSGISVKSLINADIIPGNKIIIETQSPNVQLGGINFVGFSQTQATQGEWDIFSVDHVGDSRGEEWHSNVSGFGAALVIGQQNG